MIRILSPFCQSGSGCVRPVLRVACLVATLMLGIGASAAYGQAVATVKQASPVSVHLVQYKIVVGADGKEQRLPADKVKPGDVIEYEATYQNSLAKPVNGLVADLPVPEALEYIGKSARPVAVLAATKAERAAGHFAPEPLVRSVAGPNGLIRKEQVPLAEYRELHWNVGTLAGGKAVTVSARMRVPATVIAPSAASVPAVTQ